ncbi:Dual specificity protein phosphatase 2 [Blastocladiella emersonii ATCC 22665]|nr:Dual specificity protein phosphatase 2 [Blastocladiella emersonii ATCC 22665]
MVSASAPIALPPSPPPSDEAVSVHKPAAAAEEAAIAPTPQDAAVAAMASPSPSPVPAAATADEAADPAVDAASEPTLEAVSPPADAEKAPEVELAAPVSPSVDHVPAAADGAATVDEQRYDETPTAAAIEPAHPYAPLAISCTELYGLVLESFLNILVIDVQEALNGPILVGALRRRSLRGLVAANPVHRLYGPPSRVELCLRIQADERVMNADLVIFYDEDGHPEGPAAQLAAILSSDGMFAAKYLGDGGITAFARANPCLVEQHDTPLPVRIHDLRERQAALIQAVWYSHRSATYDVPHLILPDYLYLGGQDAAHPLNLQAFGITHVIRIGYFDNSPASLAPGVEYMSHQMDDAEGEPIEVLFDQCCALIDRARATAVTRTRDDGSTAVGTGRVLVHCHAGVSRSATIVLVYMMRSLGMRLAEAFDLAFRARPIIRPNEGFGRKLQAYECALFGLEQSTMPLVWLCYDYTYAREFQEFLIRVELAGLLNVLPSSGAGDQDAASHHHQMHIAHDHDAYQPNGHGDHAADEDDEDVEIPSPLLPVSVSPVPVSPLSQILADTLKAASTADADAGAAMMETLVLPPASDEAAPVAAAAEAER